MKTTFYQRLEEDRYTPENIVGDKFIAYELDSTVSWNTDDYINELVEYDYPIACVQVEYDDETNIVSVEGYVLDACTEMYDEEEWDQFPYTEFKYSFPWSSDDGLIEE